MSFLSRNLVCHAPFGLGGGRDVWKPSYFGMFERQIGKWCPRDKQCIVDHVFMLAISFVPVHSLTVMFVVVWFVFGKLFNLTCQSHRMRHRV